MQAMPKRLAPAEPESWCTRTTDTDVAVLTIPGALDRTRTFDVDVQLRVSVPAQARKPELGLSLEVDGALRWSRSIASRMAGDVDTLEYHCRLVLEPGRDTRLRARATTRECALQRLSVSAVEDQA
jgi:hypothetical protein